MPRMIINKTIDKYIREENKLRMNRIRPKEEFSNEFSIS